MKEPQPGTRGAGPQADTSASALRPAGPVPLSAEQQSLVAGNIGLVRLHLRKRVRTSRRPRREREYDDLYQEGCIALIRAAGRYRPRSNIEFAAFALPRIRGAVHAAIRRHFSMVRRPIAPAKPAGAVPCCVSLDENLTAAPTLPPEEGGPERLKYAIRRRFERAVRRALADLHARRWRQRNPCGIIARLAAERLLIADEASRTPLRQIARDAGVSSGRAAEYERLLHEAVARRLRCDPQLPLLMHFAREDARGSDGTLDENRAQRLLQAELQAFDQRFQALPRSERASVLYALVERSARVDEIAHNLFRLAGGDADTLCPAASACLS